MQLNFFGTDEDVREIWRTLFEVPGMNLLEFSSQPDQPARWFKTWAEVEGYIDSGHWFLAAWPQSVGRRP